VICIGVRRGPVLLLLLLLLLPLFLSSSPFLFSSVQRHLNWRQDRDILADCLSPLCRGALESKRATRVHTHTHTHTHTQTSTRHRGEHWPCVTLKTPLSPSMRQTGRQLGVTLNPFPHVSRLTRASLVLSLLSCRSLYSTCETSVSFGKCKTMI